MDTMTTQNESTEPAKKRTERTCAGCGKHAEPSELVRVVHDPSSGAIAVDLANSAFGRGAHVHGSPTCLAKALKSGFARVFKGQVVADINAVSAEIVRSADRRIEGLLTGAKRAGQLALGTDTVAEALDREEAKLIIVARDALAATKKPAIERAIGDGKALAFSNKTSLGSLMGGTVDIPKEVAVIAILHSGVATAVASTYRLSGAFRGGSVGSEEAWTSSEVR